MTQKIYLPEHEQEYLKLLSKTYPTEQAVTTEIINLNAILNLPKATEHFMSDLHGEYEAFTQILRSASGAVREKIDMLFSETMTENQRASLATLIYYPKEKMELMLKNTDSEEDWYRETLSNLIEVCRAVTFKYTRSKVRKNLPDSYAYIIDELLNTDPTLRNKKEYYDNILSTIINLGKAPDFIICLCDVINRLVVDRLHIVGDIYDRGPRADIIVDSLIEHKSIDIQWGNHDIVWIGAAAGSPICIMTVLSNSILYNNLDVLEIGYGISLRPLYIFANENYALTDLSCFATRIMDEHERETVKQKDLVRTARMSKAVTILLFKLMGQVIRRNPEFHMEDRCQLDFIDYDKGTVEIGGKTYPLTDCDFPTVDIDNPYAFTEDEEDLIQELISAFKASEKLQKHIRFLFDNGNIYKCYNNNLLLHGGVPMNPDGTFKALVVDGVAYRGKELFDYCETRVRDGYYSPEGSKKRTKGLDFMWYLWCGPCSPLFARDKITTFERRLIKDQSTWKETKDYYYTYVQTREGCENILKEFGLTKSNSHIINGHTPIKSKDGESPIKGEGKLFIIDGGFSKAYQKTTGIAGYTLIYNSRFMHLSAHLPFEGKDRAIEDNLDIANITVVSERLDHRIKIKETDIGRELQKDIDHLTKLLSAYRSGLIPERTHN